MGREALALLGLALLAVPAVSVQEPKPESPRSPRPVAVADVLQRVRQRADDQALEDQRRALLLIGRAHESVKAGRMEEAVRSAQKARQLFPASAEIQRVFRNVQARQRAAKEQALNEKEALEALAEALTHVDALVEQERYYHALQLAEAVRDAAGRFAPGPEAASARAKSEKFLEEFNAWVASDPPELRAGPKEIGEPSAAAPRRAADLKRALTIPLSVDWYGERLGDAVAAIARETGVTVFFDPALERLRVPANRRLNLRVQQTPAERLLKLIGELTQTEFLLAEGHALFTTKEMALRYTLARGRDAVEADRLLRQMLPARLLSADPPPGPRPDPPPLKAPPYLESAEAFTHHIDRLLRPSGEPEEH